MEWIVKKGKSLLKLQFYRFSSGVFFWFDDLILPVYAKLMIFSIVEKIQSGNLTP
jgi:hypothetical protein